MRFIKAGLQYKATIGCAERLEVQKATVVAKIRSCFMVAGLGNTENTPIKKESNLCGLL